MTKLTFDWKRIKDEDYCKWYTETREANREECRKEVEAKYSRFWKKSLHPASNINRTFLEEQIHKACEKYGFEDAYMDPETFNIDIF